MAKGDFMNENETLGGQLREVQRLLWIMATALYDEVTGHGLRANLLRLWIVAGVALVVVSLLAR